MKTDALFYRLFQELPDCFFELVGRPASDAARYRFEAIELKDTAARIDGFYTPVNPDNCEPVFFVEVQNYKSDRTYSNLLLKVGLYLEKVNPCQDWCAVVFYPHRAMEQENLLPYRAWSFTRRTQVADTNAAAVYCVDRFSACFAWSAARTNS
jgi:predicted transposase YdaD